MRRNGVYGGNVEIIAISEICKVSVTVCFVSYGQISQKLTVIVGQVVNERNLSLLFNSKLDKGHYEVALTTEKRAKVFLQICF
jgi:hypothetical protein